MATRNPSTGWSTSELETFRTRLANALDAAASSRALFLEGTDLGDGLPLVRPDDALIDAMLEGRDGDATAVAQPVPIAFAVPTWWDLAACSVLAGCPPGTLALVGAALDALTDPAFNLLGVQATTGAASPLVIVEGDAVTRFRLHAGAGSLGPGHRPNATIGRAVRLALQGIGRSAPGEGDMATHGHPGKYTWLVAENRPDSPWAGDPKPGRVTVFAGVGSVEVVLAPTTPDELVGRLAEVIAGIAAPDNVVLLPPESAVFLARHGRDETRFRHDMAALTGRDPRIVVTGGTGVKATVVPGWGGGSQPTTTMVG